MRIVNQSKRQYAVGAMFCSIAMVLCTFIVPMAHGVTACTPDKSTFEECFIDVNFADAVAAQTGKNVRILPRVPILKLQNLRYRISK